MRFFDKVFTVDQLDNLLGAGVEYKRNGMYEKALETYLKVIDEVVRINKESTNINQKNKLVTVYYETLYSLGKLHYIIGEYDSAVRYYSSCNPLLNNQNYSGFLEMHTGHAILDRNLNGNDRIYKEAYRCSIDPYFKKFGKKEFASSSNIDLTDYSYKCANFVVENAKELGLFNDFL